jgi:hypothetical protein
MKTTITLTQKTSAAIAIDALPRLKLLAMASERLEADRPAGQSRHDCHTQELWSGKGSRRMEFDKVRSVFTLGRCCDASCTNTQRWEASPEARAIACSDLR